ncbi:hypothetical protein GCM10008013_00450 [Paenibacillus segetis]|uniref:HTH tetR-type domain-containing protein n=1 Tax=Paenibacillus segetis TaxID=1325360 RepID=A0ABQ1Y266_9BACL|nr:TetR/AcrR family transcriptional regulator [Paenibacillus segetis]GGH09404.1 hypothetical protein GCM10008013_00450 [Paenibacillus segetis]
MSQKEEISANRKEQIMKSAAALFATQGYYKTTTAHIADAVGVTQPYVFHFFKTKEQLYLAVLDRAFTQMEYAFNQVEAPADKLCTAMGSVFEELLNTQRNEMLLLMQCSATPEPKVKEFAREKYTLIYESVKTRFELAGINNSAHEASMFLAYGLIISLSAVLELPQLMP